jgi:hypothetical protein
MSGKRVETYHVADAGPFPPEVVSLNTRMLCGRILSGSPTTLTEPPAMEGARCTPCVRAFYRRRNAA